MNIFKKKRESETIPYDPDEQKAVIRCSICTGEQVAGFKNRRTGEFTEVCLIENAQDLEKFKKTYKIDTVAKEY